MENLGKKIFFFSLNDNLFGLELSIQAKVFALCYLDWGRRFLFRKWQYTPTVDDTGEPTVIIAVYLKQRARIRSNIFGELDAAIAGVFCFKWSTWLSVSGLC